MFFLYLFVVGQIPILMVNFHILGGIRSFADELPSSNSSLGAERQIFPVYSAVPPSTSTHDSWMATPLLEFVGRRRYSIGKMDGDCGRTRPQSIKRMDFVPGARVRSQQVGGTQIHAVDKDGVLRNQI